MRKYIDVEKIDFRLPYYEDEDGGDALVSLKAVKRCIAMTPSEDVIWVVRCKNCRFWQDNNGGYPHEECRWGRDETPDADDFCSYGERKENEK